MAAFVEQSGGVLASRKRVIPNCRGKVAQCHRRSRGADVKKEKLLCEIQRDEGRPIVEGVRRERSVSLYRRKCPGAGRR